MRRTEPHGLAFDAIRRPDYPRLGWLFVLASRPIIHCGDDVEIFENGVVEGCWDAPFTDFDFSGRTNLYGSGVVAHGGAWWFCPPSHTLDALYAMVHRGRTCVANSLVLLFEHAAMRPDPRVNYTKAMATALAGLDEAETVLWRNDDVVLYRILGDDFTFDGGDLRRRRKNEPNSFSDFESYRRYLLRTVSACASNAADSARRRTYRLASTCSGGYDSNAAAAVAAALGGRLALTLRSARGGEADSGRSVAEVLGLACVERDRAGRGDSAAEVEFLASGTGGGDYPLAAFEAELGGTLLLTGFHGDKVWERTVPPNPVLRRGDPSGCSLTSFRLRVGFLHIPVPFIGARRHAEIHAISNSEEMRPFSVGGTYDRPICRRILEEAGVSREHVGRAKNAVAMMFSVSPRHLSPEIRSAFEDFLLSRGMLWPVRARLAAFRAAAIGFRVVRKATMAAPLLERPLGGMRERLDRHFRTYENSSYANLLFIWALEQTLAHRAASPQARAATQSGG